MGWNTYEEILADLHAARIDKPKPKPQPPTPQQQAAERFNPNNTPTEAVIQHATAGNDALARRMEAERREMAEWNDPRVRYQRELDRWWQSKLDAEAALDDGFDYSTGYKERRYKTTCHRGKGDPDYGL
jgi:hypothetical protein